MYVLDKTGTGKEKKINHQLGLRDIAMHYLKEKKKINANFWVYTMCIPC